MAQMGCWVPAESAVLSPADRIFTRIGTFSHTVEGSLLIPNVFKQGHPESSQADGLRSAQTVHAAMKSAKAQEDALGHHKLTCLENKLPAQVLETELLLGKAPSW